MLSVPPDALEVVRALIPCDEYPPMSYLAGPEVECLFGQPDPSIIGNNQTDC